MESCCGPKGRKVWCHMSSTQCHKGPGGLPCDKLVRIEEGDTVFLPPKGSKLLVLKASPGTQKNTNTHITKPHLFGMVKRYTYRMKVNHHKNAIITNGTKAPARDPGPLRGGLPPEPLARRIAGVPPSPPNLPVNRLIEHRFFFPPVHEDK